MTPFVIDASVAAKWFLPPSGEPLAVEALRLLAGYAKGQFRFAVPDLIPLDEEIGPFCPRWKLQTVKTRLAIVFSGGWVYMSLPNLIDPHAHAFSRRMLT